MADKPTARPFNPPPQRPFNPPPQEEGLSEDVQWDPTSLLISGGLGAVAGGTVGGPPGALVGGVVGGAADLAAQIAHNYSKGLPWYLGLPAEIIAAVAGGKAAGRLFKGKVPTPPSTIAPEPTLAPPRAPGRVPVQPFADEPALGNLTTGKWPNVQVRRGPIPPIEPVDRTGSVEGQWPTVKSTGPQLGTIWRKVVPPAAEVRPPQAPLAKAPLAKPPKGVAKPSAAAAAPDPVFDDVAAHSEASYKAGMAEGWGHWFNPILSVIERTAGPRVGKQLTALEGAKQARESKHWADLFGGVVEDLRKLPAKLHDEFIDSLEGKRLPVTPQVQTSVARFRSVFGEQGSAVLAQQKAGIDIGDVLPNYFMHEFTPAFVRGLINDPARQVPVLKQMVLDGLALDQAEARRMLSSFLSRPSRNLYRDRPTGAEFDRTKNLVGYIRNPVQAVTQRGRAISRRLAEQEVYGEGKIRVRELIKQLEPGGQAERVTRLMELTMGRDPVEEGLNKLTSTVMSFHAATSLSLAGIMNMSQPAMLMLRTSIPNMAKAIFRTLPHPKQKWEAAKRLGINADMAQRLLIQEMAGGAAGKAVRGSLGFFNVTEKFVRAVAAEAGKDWARTIQNRLGAFETLGRKGQQIFLRELNNLNFTKQEVDRLLASRTLTPNDVELIRWSLADQITFLPRAARKSEFYLTNPLGPVILQFKNFLTNTGRLLRQTIWDEWRAGNKKPALRAAVVVLPSMALLGEPLADINAAVRGSRRPTGLLERAVDNVSQIGALGMGMGLLQEMTGLKPGEAGAGDAARLLGGPSAGFLTDEFKRPASTLWYASQGEGKEATRQGYESARRVARRVPYVGPIIANRLMPSSTQTPSEARDSLFDRLGFSERARRRDRVRAIESRQRRLEQAR